MSHASSHPGAHKLGNISSNISWVNHAEMPAPGGKVHAPPVAVHFSSGSGIDLSVGKETGCKVGGSVVPGVGDGRPGLFLVSPVFWQ